MKQSSSNAASPIPWGAPDLWNQFAALKALADAGDRSAAVGADHVWQLWIADFIPDPEQRRAIPRPRYGAR